MASRYKPPADFNQRDKRNIEHLNSGEQKDMAMAIITEATLVSQMPRFETEILTQPQNPKDLMSVICHI